MLKQKSNYPPSWFFYGFALLIICLDQITKFYAVDQLTPYEAMAVMPSFNLTLMFNYGAAWSFLSDWGKAATWLFSGIALLVSVGLVIYIHRLPRERKVLRFGLACVLGGAVSNLIDRISHGYVIDFFDFYYHGWHFPAFNVADMAISLGAVFWLWSMRHS